MLAFKYPDKFGISTEISNILPHVWKIGQKLPIKNCGIEQLPETKREKYLYDAKPVV